MMKPTSGRWWPLPIVYTATCLLIGLLSIQASAQAPPVRTRADLGQWLRQYSDAKPDFKPGDVITGAQIEKLRPFVPPGYLDQMNFPELRVEIIPTRSHAPRADYQACTEKYQSQVKLNADGSIANYTCGQPFADSSISVNDPQSGFKAVQNLEYRWQNYGQMILNTYYIWQRFGGSHAGAQLTQLDFPPENWISGMTFTTKMPSDVGQFFGGGGTIQRIVNAFYHRIYLNHLAQLSDQGFALQVGDAKDFIWKEFNGLFSPFDVRGTVIIDYRYSNPNRADDAWVYDPKLRRVRRITVEVKSDSVAGTDQTYEDFYTFSGRPVRWNFKFLGWKDALCVHDSKYDYAHCYGPNGLVPNDVWSLRRFAVVERIPKEPHHPYSSAVMLWDAENWQPWMMLAFGPDKNLLKISVFQQRWSEDFKDWAEINHGVQVTTPIGIQVLDLKKQQATVFYDFGSGFPTVSAEHVRQLYDISKLEEAHR